MEPFSLLGALLGIAILVFIILAIFRGELSKMEHPKYEMLGLTPPAPAIERVRGRIGIEDRIIRLGLVGPCFYYASRFGWSTFIGIALGAIGTYVLITGIAARDPIYWLCRWDTRMRDQ